MVKRLSRPYILTLGLLAGLISGINSPLIKYALATVPTALFGFLRLGVPLLLLIPYMLVKHPRIKPRSALLALALGLATYVGANGLFYLGVPRSGVITASVIGLSSPILLFVFSVEVMRERFNHRILTGILLAFAGSLLIVFGPALGHQSFGASGSLVGNLYLVAGLGCSVLGVWSAKLALRDVAATQLLFWSLPFPFLIYGLLSFHSWHLLPGIVHQPRIIGAVLFGALMNGVVVYLIDFAILRRIKGEEYSIFGYIEPEVATTLAVLFLGERPTLPLIVGVTIVFTGLYLAESHRRSPGIAHAHPIHRR